MKKYLAILALLPVLAFTTSAFAAPVTIQWQLPTQDCDGQPIASSDIEQMEIYISAGPIPASDTLCPAPGQPVDSIPDSFSSRIETTATEGSTTIDLFGGETYHVRARVRTADGWSNLSNEAIQEVPAAPVQAPVIISIGF